MFMDNILLLMFLLGIKYMVMAILMMAKKFLLLE